MSLWVIFFALWVTGAALIDAANKCADHCDVCVFPDEPGALPGCMRDKGMYGAGVALLVVFLPLHLTAWGLSIWYSDKHESELGIGGDAWPAWPVELTNSMYIAVAGCAPLWITGAALIGVSTKCPESCDFCEFPSLGPVAQRCAYDESQYRAGVGLLVTFLPLQLVCLAIAIFTRARSMKACLVDGDTVSVSVGIFGVLGSLALWITGAVLVGTVLADCPGDCEKCAFPKDAPDDVDPSCLFDSARHDAGASLLGIFLPIFLVFASILGYHIWKECK